MPPPAPEPLAVATNGITIHALAAGPPDGPLVVLLHGFPETGDAWRPILRRLAAAGFRVVAPDTRGSGRSDAPAGVGAYRVETLGRDVLGLLDAFGRERAHLAGHDWGGLIAWWLGAHAPGRLRRLAILNAPHPLALRRVMRRGPEQPLRSAYVGLFALPRLPEVLLGANGHALLFRALRRTSRDGAFDPHLLRRYRDAWSRHGALTTMLNPYRAAVRHGLTRATVPVPTTIVWGARDRFLARRLAPASLDGSARGRLVVLEEASHWLHHEEPARVAELLAEAFGAP